MKWKRYDIYIQVYIKPNAYLTVRYKLPFQPDFPTPKSLVYQSTNYEAKLITGFKKGIAVKCLFMVL